MLALLLVHSLDPAEAYIVPVAFDRVKEGAVSLAAKMVKAPILRVSSESVVDLESVNPESSVANRDQAYLLNYKRSLSPQMNC